MNAIPSMTTAEYYALIHPRPKPTLADLLDRRPELAGIGAAEIAQMKVSAA